MVDNRQHDLFKIYPIAGRMRTSLGMLPTPYHVYDGKVTFVAGTADYDGVMQLVQSEHLYPITTTKNRAMIGVWICDFLDASLGAHNELQVSIFVSPEKLPPVDNHPLVLIRELLRNPHIRMFTHGLWNTTDVAVSYNNEVLGLGARLARGGGDYQDKAVKFLFNDLSLGNLVASGNISISSSTSVGTMFDLFQLLGVRGMMQIASQPYIQTQVMNRRNNLMAFSNTSQTYTHADKTTLQRWNNKTDSIILTSPYDSLQFQPKFVEHFFGFKFVYLNQHNRVDELIK